MKFLVLGSAGLIGAHLVSYLKSQGQTVYEFDLANHPAQDLRDHDNQILNHLISQCDFVYFLAFDVGGSKFLSRYQDTFAFLSNNLKIITNTFDILEKNQKPFVFASSQMSLMLHSNYGMLKFIGERLTKILGGVAVKFWNVYGPEEFGERSHVIADFIHSAECHNKIQMITDGTECRQMLHVDDCSRALFLLAEHYDTLPRDREYHVTSFQWTPVYHIAELVAENFPGCKIIPGKNLDTVQQNVKIEPDTFVLKYWQPCVELADGIKIMIK
jgi:nucleoside-diphosphate-sugar epimerase